MKSINHRISVAVLFVLVTAATAACGLGAPRVSVTHASHDDPSDLAFGSEYLARVTVRSDPSKHTIDSESKFVKMVSVVVVDEVYAQRPGSAGVSAGDRIHVGMSLLDPNAGISIANFDELAATYPTIVEAFTKDTSVLLFFGDAADYGFDIDGKLYEATGYAIITKDNELLWKGFPGTLAGTKSDLASAVADVQSDFESTWAERGS